MSFLYTFFLIVLSLFASSRLLDKSSSFPLLLLITFLQHPFPFPLLYCISSMGVFLPVFSLFFNLSSFLYSLFSFSHFLHLFLPVFVYASIYHTFRRLTLLVLQLNINMSSCGTSNRSESFTADYFDKSPEESNSTPSVIPFHPTVISFLPIRFIIKETHSSLFRSFLNASTRFHRFVIDQLGINLTLSL